MGAAKEVLDFFAWPLKQGIFFLKLGLFITAVICAPFFICFHWVLLGNSEHKDQLNEYGRSDAFNDFVLDYSRVGGKYPFEYKNFKGEGVGLFNPPEFCITQKNPLYPLMAASDQTIDKINDETELTFHNSWVSRKTGKMYRNYVLASMTVTTMRDYLAGLKFKRSDRYYLGIACDYTLGDENIRLKGIPAIHMYVTNNKRNETYQPIILGMWIEGQGTDEEDDLPESNSHFSDIYDPVLTPGQQRAFDLMDSLRSGDFWVKAAHDNDIFGHDDQIRNHTEWLRKTLDQRLPVKYRNELLEVLGSPFRR